MFISKLPAVLVDLSAHCDVTIVLTVALTVQLSTPDVTPLTRLLLYLSVHLQATNKREELASDFQRWKRRTLYGTRRYAAS